MKENVFSSLEHLVGKALLDEYYNQRKEKEHADAMEIEQVLKTNGYLALPISYADALARTNNYIGSATHHTSVPQHLIEKSVYFYRGTFEACINTIINYPGSAYIDLNRFGYRIYFARYLNNDPLTVHDGKYTVIIRLTYLDQNNIPEDIPYPAGAAYNVALNLGNLCPPDCLGTTRPGPHGNYSP